MRILNFLLHLVLVFLMFLAGNSDGQTIIEVRRPTAELDAGATVKCGFGTKLTSPSMPSAYDAAGQATSSTITAQGTISSSFYSARSFSAWQGASSPYASLTLEIVSSLALTNNNGSSSQGALRYSLNNGATYSTVLSGTNWNKQTSTVPLSQDQDLSQIKIAVCVESTAGGDTTGAREALTLYDIWTEGRITAQSGGTGSGSGQPHRGIVIVN